MTFETLEQMLVATAEMVRPPERLTVSEAASKYRWLNNPGSYVGPWQNDTTPYLVEPMDELTSLDYTGMVFVGPAQCAKTDTALNWLTHTAICDPADMMLVQTSQSTARDFAKRRIERLFRHSPAVRERVLPGRNNQNTFDTRFTAGWMLTLSWPTINELSGKPIPRLWLTDYDRMPQNVDGEGAPFDLAKNRTKTFRRHGMTVAESSPGFIIDDPRWRPSTLHEAPPTQGILALYNRGDRRRWYWKCPQCKSAFEPDFSLLRWPDTKDMMEAAEKCYMGCPHCGGVINHDREAGNPAPGKYDLNRTGRWIKDGMIWQPNGSITGTPIRSDIASFWLKGPAAAFADWKSLVLNYLKAMQEFESTGSEEALKTTVNTDQGLPYLPRSAESERLPEEYKARAKDYGEKLVPPGVRFLLATVDVQKNRFVVQVHGFGVGGDVWVIDRFEIKKSLRTDEDGERLWVKPGAYLEDWQLLVDEVLLKTYKLADDSGRVMQIKATGCDSGGKEGVTKNAYNFWRWLRDNSEYDLHRRFLLIKGASAKSAPRVQISYPDSDRKDRNAGARGEVPVLFIHTDQMKDQVSAKLERTDPNGGCVNFPDWLPDWFYTELTVERRTVKGWENPREARNEAWDLLVYAESVALSRLVRIEQIDWENPPSWAADWPENDLVAENEDNKRFASQPKSEYNLSELAENLA